MPAGTAAYAFGDVDGKPGAELVALTGGGVRAWRMEGNKFVEPPLELLAAGFNSYSLVAGVTQGADLKETVRVRDGDPKTIPAVGGPTAAILVSRPDDRSIARRFVPSTQLRAPLAQGDRVGTIQILSGDKVLAELPAVTPTEVKMTGFAALFRSLTGK